MSVFRSRTFKVVAIAVGVIAVYGVVGGLVVPPIAKKMIASQLGERLGRTVQVDDIKLNPYTLDGTIKGFRILEADGRGAFASFDTVDLKGNWSSLYRLAPVIDALDVRGLRIRLVRDGDTHYNVSDVLARVKAAQERSAREKRDSDPVRFSLANLRLTDAAVDFDDRPNGVTQKVSGMQLAIPLVSNLPRHIKDPVQPAFSANVNGTQVKLTGEALPFADTVTTRFDLDIRGLDLPRYVAYLPSDGPAKVDAGKLDAKIALAFAQAPGKEPAVQVKGTAALSGLALSNAEGPLARVGHLDVDVASLDPLGGMVKVSSVKVADASTMGDDWKVRNLEAHDVGVDLRKHTVRVASIATDGGTFAVRRNADGSVDTPRFGSSTQSASEPAAKWRVAIDKVTLGGYDVALTDGAVRPAMTHRVSIASLEASDLVNDDGFKGKADAKLKLQGGTVAARSTFSLEPLRVKLALDAQSIDLVPLRAYVSQFPAVAIRSGAASAKGTLDIASDGPAMKVAYSGSARIDGLATKDTIAHEELLDWKSVSVRGMNLRYAPNAPIEIAAGDVTVDGAYSRIVVTRDGKLNVQQLITATEDAPEGKGSGEIHPRDIRIDRITFKESRLNFTDHYIRPNYTADVGELNGSVTHLSSDPAARAKVTLAGKWNAASPVLIAGTINPLAGDLFLDIAARGEQIDLTKLTAYSQRYAGYGIKDGRLTLDVKYHVENGKLEGRNKILVDRLAFGDKVESPDATKLPVLFAINLLKDKNGRIDLTLPVSGSLEDPQFDIMAVVGQIFGSPLKAAETSPFSLIAAGEGAGDDLAYVEFQPGAATLTPDAEKKLATLVKILEDRPGLKLELAARCDAAKDTEALKKALLAQRLAAAPRDLPKEAREKLAAQPIEVGQAELDALAAQRAELVKAYLSATGRLPADRVVVASSSAKAPDEPKAHLSRVDFALR